MLQTQYEQTMKKHEEALNKEYAAREQSNSEK
jgi:hypothetical protein